MTSEVPSLPDPPLLLCPRLVSFEHLVGSTGGSISDVQYSTIIQVAICTCSVSLAGWILITLSRGNCGTASTFKLPCPTYLLLALPHLYPPTSGLGGRELLSSTISQFRLMMSCMQYAICTRVVSSLAVYTLLRGNCGDTTSTLSSHLSYFVAQL